MSSRVFVGNLSRNADNEFLSEHFSQYGQVTDAVIIQDRETGGSRGFGFVTFSTPEEASLAVEKANNKEFYGRALTVTVAVERTERADGRNRDFGYAILEDDDDAQAAIDDLQHTMIDNQVIKVEHYNEEEHYRTSPFPRENYAYCSRGKRRDTD